MRNKGMKKFISVLLVFALCLTQYSLVFAGSSIKLTKDRLEKIIAPYSNFLESGVWDLLEYEEIKDGELFYKMRMDNDQIVTVSQTEGKNGLVLEVTEGNKVNVLEILPDKTAYIDGREVRVESNENVVITETRQLFDWRESGPYYGTPGIYTKQVSRSEHNVILDQAIADFTSSLLIAYVSIYVPAFGVYMETIARPAAAINAVIETYQMFDPNNYAIYLEHTMFEPEALYITPGSGYLKWVQAFYFDEDYDDFAYDMVQWGRTAS